MTKKTVKKAAKKTATKPVKKASPPSPPTVHQQENDLIGQIMAAQPAEGLALIQQAEAGASAEEAREITAFLAPFKQWHLANYYAGQSNFEAAGKAATAAGRGFLEMGVTEMQAVADGLGVYYRAAHELTSGNIAAGLKQFEDFKAMVQASGNPDLFQLQELQQPHLLYISAARALQTLDQDRAHTLYSQAVLAAEQIAAKFPEGSAERSGYIAFARIYDADGRYQRAMADVRTWNFADLAMITPLGESYNEAIGHLKKVQSPLVDNLERLGLYFPAGISILSEWAQLVNSEPVTAEKRQDVIVALQKRLEAAQKHLSAAGEQVLPVIRGIESVKNTLEQYQEVMEGVAERANRAAARTGPIILFVMIPFDDAYKPLEQSLRDVFETDPYNFQVLLARDSKIDKDLFPNIRKLMHMADGFIGDISEHNPSVMMEIGIAAADAMDRPFLILRNKDKKPTPADLEGRLRVEYTTPLPGSDPVKTLAAVLAIELRKIEEFEQLRRNRRSRFLSKTHLRSVAEKGGVFLRDPDQFEAVLARYKTVEEVLARDALQLARETRLPARVAGNLLEAFRSNEPVKAAATGTAKRARRQRA